jgi:hypothetical protein
MAARSPWDSDEIAYARELFASGLTWAEVGERLGRTALACRDAVSRHYGKIDDGRTCYDGPAIPLTTECTKYRANCRLGSHRLAEAINQLIDRMPTHDVSIMLGKPHLAIPGTERIYKTSSAERMAA